MCWFLSGGAGADGSLLNSECIRYPSLVITNLKNDKLTLGVQLHIIFNRKGKKHFKKRYLCKPAGLLNSGAMSFCPLQLVASTKEQQSDLQSPKRGLFIITFLCGSGFRL